MLIIFRKLKFSPNVADCKYKSFCCKLCFFLLYFIHFISIKKNKKYERQGWSIDHRVYLWVDHTFDGSTSPLIEQTVDEKKREKWKIGNEDKKEKKREQDAIRGAVQKKRLQSQRTCPLRPLAPPPYAST